MKKLAVIIALAFLLVACKSDDSQLEERIFALESRVASVEAFIDAQNEVNSAVSIGFNEILSLFQHFHPIGGP